MWIFRGKGLILLIIAYLIPTIQLLAQSGQIDEAKRLLLKVASEREKLVVYRYNLAFRCENQTELSAARTFPNGLAVTVEHSQIDGHVGLVFDYSRCKKELQQPTRWLAHSGKYSYGGVAGGKSTLNRREKIPGSMLRFFDIKGIGLGFWGDLKLGTNHTQLFENLLDTPSEVSVRKIDANSVEFQRLKGFSVTFEAEKGFWPSKSVTPHAHWDIEIDKIQGIFVPSSFTIKTFGAKPEIVEDEIKAEIEWTHVNQPFPVAREAARELATQFASEFREPSDNDLFSSKKK